MSIYTLTNVRSMTFVVRKPRDKMETDLMKLLLDPLKQRLILGLYDRHEATINDLCDICPDIPRSTIYRHMSKMEKENMVTVVRTARKRGTVEKTFTLNENLFGKPDAPPNKDTVSILFSRFCMEYLRRCGDYLDGYEGKPEDMRFSFSSAPFYATDDELNIFLERLGRMLQDMVKNQPSPDRKLYSFGQMLFPDEETPYN